MTMLSGLQKNFARNRLLSWDRARVAQACADGYDCSVYQARQDLADACLEIDTDEWPNDVRFLYMAILEITRTPSKARAINIGAVRPIVLRLTFAERLLYRAFARAIGVIDRLKEVAPRQWADEDTEGA